MRQPLLAELATRMKTRVAVRVEPQLGVPDAPCASARRLRRHHRASPRRPTCAYRAEWLLRRGAEEVLVLPQQARRPAARADPLDGRSGARRDARGFRQRAAPRVRPRRSTSASCRSDAAPRGRTACATARRALRGAGGARPGDAHRAALRRRRAASWRGSLARPPAQMLILGVARSDALRRALPLAARRAATLAGADRAPDPAARSVSFRAAERAAGLRADVRLHDLLPERHRAAAAGGAGADGRPPCTWRDFVRRGRRARARSAPTGCPSAPRCWRPRINLVFGFIIAWTLARYEFPGRKLIDALIDMPFALPTAVSGIALTTVFAQNGWIGRYLEPLGIKVAYTWIGVTVALTLIGMPFAVRSVQPALLEVQRDLEDAAETLGAGRFYVFRRIILPTVLPALLTGFTLAFARARGRVRLGDLHRRQPADEDRDHPAADRHPARGVRLPGRRRARLRDAGRSPSWCCSPSTCCRPGAGGGIVRAAH